MHEYSVHGKVYTSAAELVAALSGAKEFRAVFAADSDVKRRAQQFDLVCRLAMATGNLDFIAEELRFVTTPSRAPLGWAQVTLTGRHKGLRVIGSSQRPASIDKDFLGNCTKVHVGRLVYPEDVRAVSKATGITEADIGALKPLDWLEKDTTTGKITRGRLVF